MVLYIGLGTPSVFSQARTNAIQTRCECDTYCNRDLVIFMRGSQKKKKPLIYVPKKLAAGSASYSV